MQPLSKFVFNFEFHTRTVRMVKEKKKLKERLSNEAQNFMTNELCLCGTRGASCARFIPESAQFGILTNGKLKLEAKSQYATA